MSDNIGRAIGLVNQIRAGTVWINTYDMLAIYSCYLWWIQRVWTRP